MFTTAPIHLVKSILSGSRLFIYQYQDTVQFVVLTLLLEMDDDRQRELMCFAHGVIIFSLELNTKDLAG